MAKRYHDGGQMKESKNDFANMPQEVVHKKYPKGSYGIPGGYRDNMEGIDAFARENHSRVMKQIRKPSDA